jgi:hypothetical protein
MIIVEHAEDRTALTRADATAAEVTVSAEFMAEHPEILAASA